MIIQYYKGNLNIIKVVVDNRNVMIYDSNIVRNGISVEQVLARDIEKLKKWKLRIKNMTEEEIAKEIQKDLKEDNGLILSSEEIRK